MNDIKTALITGANKGIGHEIAFQLGAMGYVVWLGCRDEQRGQAAAEALRQRGIDARALLLDVTVDDSVSAAARIFSETSDHLDALINNAGIALGGLVRPSEAKIEDIRSVYDVNTFGAIRVTQAFLPSLRKAPAARIVMMSSSLGSISAALDPTSETYLVNQLAYNSSKSALNMATVMFAKDLLAEGIKVNAANPGFVATDLNNHRGTRTVEEGARIAVHLATLPMNGPTAGFFHDGCFTPIGRHDW